jgi:hypothetical protein
MTKFLDTYETWDKVFKLTKDNNDHYKMFIHDNCWNSPKMSTMIMDKKEMSGLIAFLQSFLENSLDN